ncbi:MAG: trypco2 family protein [Planctomycetota bacterium]
MHRIDLAELVKHVRLQLKRARREGLKHKMPFEVSELELELQVTVEKQGDAGLTFGFVSAEGTVAKESIQKVNVKIRPVSEDGGSTFIGDEDEDDVQIG